MKISRISPLFLKDEGYVFTNSRPICPSAPYISFFLEITVKRIWGYSAIKLDINNFNESKDTIDIFIDLSKGFYAVSHGYLHSLNWSNLWRKSWYAAEILESLHSFQKMKGMYLLILDQSQSFCSIYKFCF